MTGSMTKQLDCHHIRPVEGAHTVDGPDGMKARCYDPNNIMLVCQDCHVKIHTEAKSHTKEKVKENKERARRRFLEANDPNWGTHQEQREPETNESGTHQPTEPTD